MRGFVYVSTFNKSVNIYGVFYLFPSKSCTPGIRADSFASFILFIEIQAPLWPQKYDAVRMDAYYSLHPYVQHICKVNFVNKRFRRIYSRRDLVIRL